MRTEAVGRRIGRWAVVVGISDWRFKGSGVQKVERFKGSGVEARRMGIERFEGIETGQLAPELTRKIYRLTKKAKFSGDFGLKRQLQDASGSSMHNIAKGFDSESNREFVRFLRYAKRSCTEVQSELYVALDQQYITKMNSRMCMILPEELSLQIEVSSSILRYMKKIKKPKNNPNTPEYMNPSTSEP